MKTFFFLILFTSFVISSVFADAVLEDSENWPTFARVRSGASAPVKSSVRGVLIRIEGQEALIDFGREGLQRLAIEQTDILENAQRLADKVDRKRIGNFTATLDTTLIYVKEGRYLPYPLVKTAAVRHFLVAYIDPQMISPELMTLLSRLSEGFTDKTMLVIVARDPLVREWMRDNGLSYPTLSPHMALANWTTFHHEPLSGGLTFVLLDHNGKVFERLELSSLADQAPLDRLRASCVSVMKLVEKHEPVVQP